jgi:hypothetical protein|tara:strand:+ start:3225 stop:3425 length:201 start_codon:yes stop_codon:yes gene_type:complete
MNDTSKVLRKVRELSKAVARIPMSIKKDEQGCPQKEKRVLNIMVNNIYKELVTLTRQQAEEKREKK